MSSPVADPALLTASQADRRACIGNIERAESLVTLTQLIEDDREISEQTAQLEGSPQQDGAVVEERVAIVFGEQQAANTALQERVASLESTLRGREFQIYTLEQQLEQSSTRAGAELQDKLEAVEAMSRQLESAALQRTQEHQREIAAHRAEMLKLESKHTDTTQGQLMLFLDAARRRQQEAGMLILKILVKATAIRQLQSVVCSWATSVVKASCRVRVRLSCRSDSTDTVVFDVGAGCIEC